MADSPTRPQLAVVEDFDSRGQEGRSERSGAAEAGEAAGVSPRSARRMTFLWVAAVVLLGLLLAYEVRYAGRLEVRVEELSVELGRAREAIGLYQRRMGRVRRDVDELASRVAALQELVKEEVPPAPGSSPPKTDGGQR